MAAPASMTTLDLSGKFYMSKTESDDTDDVLSEQGIGWFVRKSIKLATITFIIKHYKDKDGVEHIDVDQTLTGGIKGTSEERTLDWTERAHSDHIFGEVVGKTRRIKPSELSDKWLSEGWDPTTIEHGLVDSLVRSDAGGWTANQVWGFEEVKGVRKFVRHLLFTKGSKRLDKRLVYDYIGPLDTTKSDEEL